jgi:hypothetical protein
MKYCCNDLKPSDWNYCPFCGRKIEDTTEEDELERTKK